MAPTPLLLLLLLPLASCAPSCTPPSSVVTYPAPVPPTLTVGAFNIRVFGRTKAGKPDIMNNIVQILNPYDIILIQEIRDAKETVAPDLLELLQGAGNWAMEVSTRMGRSSQKEQLTYFYKPDRVTILGVHQYLEGTEGDVFEREPYSVHIRAHMPGTVKKELVLMGAHLKPSSTLTVQEIHALDSFVYNDTFNSFQTHDMLIMGDLNADCNYLSNTKRESTKLFTDSKYLSLIPNEADTTTTNSDCAYDRMFATGGLQDKVLCAGIDHFQLDLDLSVDQMHDVSDHWPVFARVVLDSN